MALKPLKLKSSEFGAASAGWRRRFLPFLLFVGDFRMIHLALSSRLGG